MRKIVHVGRLRYVIYMGDKRGSLWHYIPLHLVMVMRYSVLCFFIMHLMIQHIGSVVVRGVGWTILHVGGSHGSGRRASRVFVYEGQQILVGVLDPGCGIGIHGLFVFHF